MTTEALTAAGLAPDRDRRWPGECVGRQRAGSRGDRLFVVEADEYDQAFLTLHPTVAIVNNVEPDHLECYGSIEALEEAFVEFAGRARAADRERRRSGRAGASRRRLGRGLCGSGSVPTPTCGIADVIAATPIATEPRVRWPTAARLRSGCRCPGCTTSGTPSAALGAVRALGGTLEPRARGAGGVRRRGAAVRAAGRARRGRGGGRLRAPPHRSSRRRSPRRGRRIPGGGSWPCSSRISTRARPQHGAAMGRGARRGRSGGRDRDLRRARAADRRA